MTRDWKSVYVAIHLFIGKSPASALSQTLLVCSGRECGQMLFVAFMCCKLNMRVLKRVICLGTAVSPPPHFSGLGAKLKPSKNKELHLLAPKGVEVANTDLIGLRRLFGYRGGPGQRGKQTFSCKSQLFSVDYSQKKNDNF